MGKVGKMSRIQQVQPNYQQKAKLNSQQSYAYKPNFGSAASAADDAAAKAMEEAAKAIAKASKKAMTTSSMNNFDILALKEGELENQIINNIFTATLAPVMIALNPFSKKPKEDREYLAWRQPLSAVIALLGGMPATIIINKHFSQLGNEGYFKSLDMRISPDKIYLKDRFKNEFKNTPEKDFYAKYNISEEVQELKTAKGFIDNTIRYKAKLFDAFVEAKKAEATDFFAELISTDRKNITIDKDGKVSILDKEGEVKKIKTKQDFYSLNKEGKFEKSEIENEVEYSRNIPNMKTPEQLDTYLKENSLFTEGSFGQFMKKNFGFQFYKDGKIKNDNALRKIGETNAKEFLEVLGLYEKADTEAISRILNIVRQVKTADEIAPMVPFNKIEKLGKAESVPRKFVESFGKLFSRASQLQQGEKASSKSNMSFNQLLERLGLFDPGAETDTKKINAMKLEKLQDLMNKSTAEITEILKSKLKENGETFEKDGKLIDTLSSFAKNYMKKIAKNADENFKNVSKLNGIVANLFVVMGTCSVLNWVYPRFMDKFFPHLSKSRSPQPSVQTEAQKGGNK